MPPNGTAGHWAGFVKWRSKQVNSAGFTCFCGAGRKTARLLPILCLWGGGPACLRKALGRKIAAGPTGNITFSPAAKRIAAQPEPENKAARGLPLSRGFSFDTEKGIDVKSLL